MSYNLIEIGKTGNYYGTNGFIRIRVFKEFENSLNNAKFLFIEQDGGQVPYGIESVDLNKPKSIKLEDINTVKNTHQISGAKIYLREGEIIPEEEEEKEGFYFLESYIMFSDKNKEIGKIEAVWSMNHHDLASIDYKGKEVFIPLHEDSIIEIDEKKKFVFVEIVEGLLEL